MVGAEVVTSWVVRPSQWYVEAEVVTSRVVRPSW